jgi:hypothetical protein
MQPLTPTLSPQGRGEGAYGSLESAAHAFSPAGENR